MNESRLSHEQGQKKMQNNRSPALPHKPRSSSRRVFLFFFPDFSTPKPEVCILGCSSKAGMLQY